MASTISLNTKIEQLYKLLENCKAYLSPSGDSQRQGDVIPLLRNVYELIKLPAVKHHSTFPRLLTMAMQLLLSFCGSRDHSVRLAASDVINKTIKTLQQDHMSRVIHELFQEVKKKGESPVLRAALTRFAVLCSRIRQQKCPQFSQQLLPLVTQLLACRDDTLQDCLQDALPKLLLVFGTHYSEEELVKLAECCVEQLASDNPANRRTAAEVLPQLCQHCLKPVKCTKWSIAHLMLGLLTDVVKDHVICGLLLCLRQIIPLVAMEVDDVSILPMIFVLLLRCCLHSNHNVVAGALEGLSVLLWKPGASLRTWLTTRLDHMTLLLPIGCHSDSVLESDATLSHPPGSDVTSSASADATLSNSVGLVGSPSNSDVMSDDDMLTPPSPTGDDIQTLPPPSGGDLPALPSSNGESEDDGDGMLYPSASDATPPSSPGCDEKLLNACDDLFIVSSTTDVSVSVSLASARPTSATPILSCDLPYVDLSALQLPGTSTCLAPIEVLLNLLGTRLLVDHMRISVKAVAMQCIVAIATWSPKQLLVTVETENCVRFIELLLPYMESDDPKLCGNCCQVLACYIKGLLLWDNADDTVSSVLDHVIKVLSSNSATVLHAAIPSLQAFIATLATSQFNELLDVVMETVINLSLSQSYWLVKCDLLYVMTSLDHTLLRHAHRQAILHYVLNSVGSVDHRVQDHAVEAVARLVKQCCISGADHMIQTAQHMIPQYLNFVFYSVGKDHMIQPGLSTSLQFVIQHCHGHLCYCSSQHELVGTIKCLRQLCHDYPPTFHEWCGCLSLIEHLLGLMEGSSLSYDLCCHANMLFIASTLIVAMATKHLISNPEPNKEWAAIGMPFLVTMVKRLFRHCMRCVKICHTVLDEQVNDGVAKVTTASIRQSNQKTSKPVVKKESPKAITKHSYGNFTNIPHYVKIFRTVKNVYRVYQVTMETATTDKFYTFLCSTLGGVASLLDIALADDVAKITDELCSYLSVLNIAEPWTGLLCVQQLLNALFGMNTAVHRVNMLSPILLSHVTSSMNIAEPLPLLLDTLMLHPLHHMITSLTVHGEVGVADNTDGSHGNTRLQGIKRLRGLFSKKATNTLPMDSKPANSSAVVKEHIRHFEPLVVNAMKQFSSTTSLLLQERTLFLVIQLLHLRVNYQLLDPNKTFLDSVLRLLEVIDKGHVRGSGQLIPYLFQFLVLLSWEQPKLMSIPEVMQRCDQVLVSGRNVSTYAIPALQPLVVNLFMRSNLPLKGEQLEAEREVVLMMLLRLLGYHQVVNMCALVLECYHGNRTKWIALSNQILPVLLPYLAKFKIAIDTIEAIASLFRLMSVIAMETVNLRALFELLLNTKELDAVGDYVMWAGLHCAVLRSVNRLLNESKGDELLSALKGCCFSTWPRLSAHVIHEAYEYKLSSSTVAMQLVEYLMSSLHYSFSVLQSLQTDLSGSCEYRDLLTQLCFDWLLSLRYMSKSPCDQLWTSFRDYVINDLPQFSDHSWWGPVVAMASSAPLLLLHYTELLSIYGYHDNSYWEWLVTSCLQGPYREVINHATFLIMCNNKLTEHLEYLLCHHANQWVSIIDKMWTEPAIQLYWKGSCDTKLTINALASLDYDEMNALQIRHCFKLITHFQGNHTSDVIPVLCRNFIGSHVLAVAMAAQRIVVDKISSKYVDVQLVRELLKDLPPYKLIRCDGLLEALDEDKISLVPVLDQSECDDTWLEDQIKKCCHGDELSSNMVAQLLHNLPTDVMRSIMKDQKFNTSHLVCCLAAGIQYTKSSKLVPLEEVGPDVTMELDKLLTVTKDVICERMVSCETANEDLLLAILWLLITNSLLRIVWQEPDNVAIVKYVEMCKCELVRSDTLFHVVAMLLQSHDLAALVSNSSIRETTAMLYQKFCSDNQPIKSAEDGIIELLDCSCTEMLYKQLVYGLARLPLVNRYALAPPTALQLGWQVDEALPINLLKERDVIEEGLIKRTNQIGWLSRLQFEEIWVQSLSVLNLSATDCNSQQDHVMLICRGLQSVTSLLVMTLWRPEPGNPLIGNLLCTSRHRNIPFLDSKPGKHFAHMRQRIENELLVTVASRGDVSGYHGVVYEDDTQIHLYSNNVERKIGSNDLSYGQLSLHSLWSLTHRDSSSDNNIPLGRGEVDTKSCIVLLIDLFTQWLTGDHLSHVILTEIIRSVVLLSDLFFTSKQYEWMLLQFAAVDEFLASEDKIGHSYLIYGMLKCVAVLRMTSDSVVDHVSRSCDLILQDGGTNSMLAQEACLRGLLYCMEAPGGDHVIPAVSNSLCSYCLDHLKHYERYCEQHLLLVWAVTMEMIECRASEIHQENFITGVVMICVDVLRSHDPILSFHRALCHGLEQLLLTFSLSSAHRNMLCAASISRLSSGRSSYSETLSALGLLLCCVYTGDEGEALIGVTMDTTAVARERIASIIEWLRRAPHPYTVVITQILPQLMVDLLPPSEAVSMVMNEFLSQQQVHMKSAAAMLVEVFQRVHRCGNSHVITNWMLLMIGNALKREPLSMAIWYSCCLLVAACTNDVLLKMLPLVTDCSGEHLVVMETFHHAGIHFYIDQLTVNDHRVDFVKLLTEVAPLHHCYKRLLMACNNVT